MRKFHTSLVAGALLLMGSGSSFAQNPAAGMIAKKMDQFVTDHAIEFIDGKLSDEQTTHLKLISHQVAVASTCDGFELDDEKFIDAFGKLAHEQESEMNDAEKQYFERHLLVTYGVMVGGALSVAALDPAGYCEEAEAERSEAVDADWMVWRTGE